MGDRQFFQLAGQLVKQNYIEQAEQTLRSQLARVNNLLQHRRLPDVGWDDSAIQHFLQQLSMMDSNNFSSNVGVGEREGRVFSNLVRARHYYFAHGIGRSGDIAEDQPKAAGSSLIYKLTNALALHALQLAGAYTTKAAIVLPLATGMSLALALQTIRARYPATAKYVLWSRIDQKSCIKCMFCAGLIPLVAPLIQNPGDDELQTNVAFIREVLEGRHRLPDGHLVETSEILCVLTTTVSFAPRAPDRVIDVARMCKEFNIPHICNNAYGVQSSRVMHWIAEAQQQGRLDCYVQSTDKNFLVPVGGAIVASRDKQFIKDLAKMYPGRASLSPILDLFVTLLSMGARGFTHLLAIREQNFIHFKNQLYQFCSKYGERVLNTPNNPISLAITVSADRVYQVDRFPKPPTHPDPTASLVAPPSSSSESASSSTSSSASQSPTEPSSSESESGASVNTSLPSPPPPPPSTHVKPVRKGFLGASLYYRLVSGTRVLTVNPVPVPAPVASDSTAPAVPVEGAGEVANQSSSAPASSQPHPSQPTHRNRGAAGRRLTPSPTALSTAAAPSTDSNTLTPTPSVIHISGLAFRNFGTHVDHYHGTTAYLTMACALGMTLPEIDTYFQRLDDLFRASSSSATRALSTSPLPLPSTVTPTSLSKSVGLVDDRRPDDWAYQSYDDSATD